LKLLEGTVVNVPPKEDVSTQTKICWGKHTKHLVYRGAFNLNRIRL
jgi:hypothetical protein